MNYIREMNAFRDWLMLNDLSSSEVALWYTLMSVNNKSGWKEWFTAPNLTLQQLAKLSKQGVANARAALKTKGLIDYRGGSRNKQAGSYKMISLANLFDQSLDHSLAHDFTITKQKTNGNINKYHGGIDSPLASQQKDRSGERGQFHAEYGSKLKNRNGKFDGLSI